MTSPYAPPPSSSLQKPPSLVATDQFGNPLPQLLDQPRCCSAGLGWTWLVNAFALLKQEFLLWVGMGFALLLILIFANFIPFIGGMAGYFILIFIGGMMQGCAAQAQGEELRFDHLFAGFKTHIEQLLILCLLYFAASLASIVIALIVVLLFGGFSLAMFSGGLDSMMLNMDDLNLFLFVMIIVLFMLLLMIPIMMAIWFAPALIVLHNMDAMTAMKKSFQGCWVNMLPFTVYGLILMVALPLLVLFTLGLGLLIITPWMIIGYYTSYRDVWTDQPMVEIS
ncbi:DUF898 domain-containing protein [Psychrobacter sp. I-STPA10]|uniref:DUF898 domain-containing protein n=1 Tax=Psychrobacter sp. I-STPA10 TaxID=2585769 RepID=UPI001E2DAF47|nr:DUF898 domain-containing protein [Psychrobacter sp. I-STPA10]